MILGSIPGVDRSFPCFKTSRLAVEATQPPLQQVLGSLSLRINQMEHLADHSTPPCAETENK